MYSILIVDDEPGFRHMIRKFLEMEGFHVIEASDGAGAIKVFQTTTPDMVILDVHMQGMDGFDTCRKLREDAYGASIPILFLSGMTGEEDKVRGLLEGGDDYICKPFNPKEFLARIKTNIRRIQNSKSFRDWLEHKFDPGSILQGSNGQQYRIESRLSSGGMGVIFYGVRISDNLPVVIKTLNSSFLDNYKDIQRFLREAQTTISLNHPNIVSGLDVVSSEKSCFFVMRFVSGKSLALILDENGRISQQLALHIAKQITRGIIHMNQHGVVHRDIKPGNILIDPNWNAVLVDLGLAKAQHNNKKPDLTTEGVILGTPYYLSPEQATGDNLDIRSDIYSLGATLYHCITGMVPFRGSTTIAIINSRFLNDPLPAQDVIPEIHPDFSRVISKMMAKSLTNRYQTPEELLVDLENLQL